MRHYLLLLVLICSNGLIAQESLDTIYANDKKNVALFFPNPIRQGITGADHFIFTYNRETAQYFGLLQAKPGLESNLLTITDDGNVYSYILKYANTLTKLNYFVNKRESIGNEKPVLDTTNSLTKMNNPYINRITHFQKFSTYLLKTKMERLATVRKKGLKLSIQKMVYNASEVYLVLEIANNSGIDFEIDYLKIYRANGNKKRKASFQRLPLEVIYKYKLPDIINNKQSNRFVYVLPKFVLGDNEKLMIELQELKGNRKLLIKSK